MWDDSTISYCSGKCATSFRDIKGGKRQVINKSRGKTNTNTNERIGERQESQGKRTRGFRYCQRKPTSEAVKHSTHGGEGECRSPEVSGGKNSVAREGSPDPVKSIEDKVLNVKKRCRNLRD